MTVRVVPKGLGLAGLRSCLEGKLLDRACLSRFEIGSRDKGKWGKANERLAGLTLSPSTEPDLEDGELKTTVRGTDGRFRESVKICMTGHSPMVKLDHVYLVVARDQNRRDLKTLEKIKTPDADKLVSVKICLPRAATSDKDCA